MRSDIPGLGPADIAAGFRALADTLVNFRHHRVMLLPAKRGVESAEDLAALRTTMIRPWNQALGTIGGIPWQVSSPRASQCPSGLAMRVTWRRPWGRGKQRARLRHLWCDSCYPSASQNCPCVPLALYLVDRFTLLP